MSDVKQLLLDFDRKIQVGNRLNQQVNNFYCLSGLVSGKYYGLQIWNVQTEKKLLVDFDENFSNVTIWLL